MTSKPMDLRLPHPSACKPVYNWLTWFKDVVFSEHAIRLKQHDAWSIGTMARSHHAGLQLKISIGSCTTFKRRKVRVDGSKIPTDAIAPLRVKRALENLPVLIEFWDVLDTAITPDQVVMHIQHTIDFADTMYDFGELFTNMELTNIPQVEHTDEVSYAQKWDNCFALTYFTLHQFDATKQTNALREIRAAIWGPNAEHHSLANFDMAAWSWFTVSGDGKEHPSHVMDFREIHQIFQDKDRLKFITDQIIVLLKGWYEVRYNGMETQPSAPEESSFSAYAPVSVSSAPSDHSVPSAPDEPVSEPRRLQRAWERFVHYLPIV